ncbi:C-C chemokine receptor type 6 [Hyperolius riggenbachi]|uniref:C-C chemokine receptor type 6 n=1 Tax=Hyperolius riggenbachi TaxID=752182 RepID=UPI0035A2D929
MMNVTTYMYDDYYPTEDDQTFCRMDSVRGFLKAFGPPAFSFIFVFGLVGNIMVVITFSCYKKSRTMTDVFLLNMAIADILFTFTLPFWAVYYHKSEWIFRDFMCKLVRGIYAINYNCSMLLLACVGIDRYVAIVQVTKSFRLRSIALAYKGLLCLSIWIAAACLSSITYVYTEAYKQNEQNELSPYVCAAKYPEKSAIQMKVAVLFVEVSVGFLIPFLVMVFCYTCIIITLLQAKNSQRHKAILVIVIVVVVFLLCQVPHNLMLLKKAFTLGDKNGNCTDTENAEYALHITKFLAFLHCCLNPVIYAFIGVKFRNYFVKIVQNFCRLHKTSLSRTRSSRFSSDMYSSRRTSEVFPSEGGSSFTV